MQPRGELQNCWLIFYHVKCVHGWTTMAYHVYDLMYCKMFTIAICNMQCKSIEVQCVMWKKLNHVILRFSLANPNFKGFMVDSVSQPQPWACKGVGQEGSLGVTSHALESAKECEGMNPHTPKELPLWELESRWTLEFSEGDYRGQNPL